MLNVTHYAWTLANIRHPLKISGQVGGKPFIINTACHPLRRGLGRPPTTATHHPKVDAYIWINRPAHSGGSCNGGPLPVGSWWPERALELARYVTHWISPPDGTRFGLLSPVFDPGACGRRVSLTGQSTCLTPPRISSGQ
jgi:hypothetical protein